MSRSARTPTAFLIRSAIAIGFLCLPGTATADPIRDRIIEQLAVWRGPLPFPAGMTRIADIAYGPAPEQKMDVYRPENAAAAPVILMVHGGAWTAGDKADPAIIQNKLARWIPKGIILVSANYRLSPGANPLQQAEDIAKALALAQSLAPAWGGDPARFILMGNSAGAHLVTLLAADPDIAVRQGAQPWLGVISLDSAGFDITRTMAAPHFPYYDAVFGTDEAYWRDASPTLRMNKAPAPILLACSMRWNDKCEGARRFAAKVDALGGRAVLLPVHFTHGNVNDMVGQAEDYTAAIEDFMRMLGLP
ncbi:MAG: alpha/beta hydrolase [Pseudomonadota bacterium]